ncbi:MAG: hypothetical protein ACK5NK_04840 [Niabella sp.]
MSNKKKIKKQISDKSRVNYQMSKRANRIYNELDTGDKELIKIMSNYLCSFVEGEKVVDTENVKINNVHVRGLIPTFMYKHQTNFEIDVMDIERLITLGLFQFKFKPELYLPKGEAHYMVVSNKIYKIWPRENTALSFIRLTKEGAEIFGLPTIAFRPEVESYYRNLITYFPTLRFDEIGKHNK